MRCTTWKRRGFTRANWNPDLFLAAVAGALQLIQPFLYEAKTLCEFMHEGNRSPRPDLIGLRPIVERGEEFRLGVFEPLLKVTGRGLQPLIHMARKCLQPLINVARERLQPLINVARERL